MEVTSVVLAGGKSMRLGRDKVREIVGSQSLIESVIQRVRPISKQVLVVTSREKTDLPVSGDHKVLIDLYPDKGPLGGIYTGLLASQTPINIIVACDMPFLNTELLRYMAEQCGDYDAVVPRLGDGMLEPLHAVYSKKCLDRMRDRLEDNRLGVHSFLEILHVRYIERDECQRLDPRLLSFFDINNQSDLDRAISLAGDNGT